MAEPYAMAEPALKKRKRNDDTVYGDPNGPTQFSVISQADLKTYLAQAMSSYLSTPLTQIVIQYAPPKLEFTMKLQNLTNAAKVQCVAEILQYGIDRCRSRATEGFNSLSIPLFTGLKWNIGRGSVDILAPWKEDAEFMQILANVFSQAGLKDVRLVRTVTGVYTRLSMCW
jgi:hypothetical protein